MLPAIVLIAEGLVVLWFLLFLTMITSIYLDGRDYGPSKASTVERSFLKHVRIFVSLGIPAGCLVALADAFQFI
ncbi:hypothetical protein GCM10007094_31560 [Pseudovibrio japonicus]|uniref:Uncharacterized protein n=1 Tax=Pseudovibrio japonicus TaxID=366534 RepID=A0ABQ3ELA5_9HYPH|nr:hypothetical protein [Pseudovibrio japonicus]GHB39972.1 hypothetical protein GCM10007094_31560 [Pseudovibrio japonicus]